MLQNRAPDLRLLHFHTGYPKKRFGSGTSNSVDPSVLVLRVTLLACNSISE